MSEDKKKKKKPPKPKTLKEILRERKKRTDEATKGLNDMFNQGGNF